MPKDKRSFFERLTGSISVTSDEPAEESQEQDMSEERPSSHSGHASHDLTPHEKTNEEWLEEVEDNEGQLTVDVYQTGDHIIIHAPMAGVKPEDVDVSITRDMITIRGKREHHHEAEVDDYYYQELYWGSFSRSILLPCEVDPDSSEANIRHGLLVLKLPKLDKNRAQHVQIKGE